MRKSTIKKIQLIFVLIIFSFIGFSSYYMFNKPDLVPSDNMIVKNVMFYQGNNNKNATIIITWQKKVKSAIATKKENYLIEQVKPNGRKWVLVPKGKNFKIENIQYVYAPWVDTEEKRKKASPEKKDEKVIELNVKIDPKEEPDDYFKVTVKNIETESGEKFENEEYAVVQVNSFLKFLRI